MDSPKDILIYGAGSHAKVILDLIEKGDGSLRVVGLVDDDPCQGDVFGYPVFSSLSEPLARGVRAGLVAIGDNWTRSQVVRRILNTRSDFEFVAAVHPSAQIGRNVEIGPGTVVMAGVCINVGTRIGRHCIVNTSASVDHDNLLGDFVSIGPGAVLGGSVRIGRLSAIGLGACVINDLDIGECSVVGAGSTVTKNVPDHVVAYGSPCRVVRPRKADEPYLATRDPSEENMESVIRPAREASDSCF